MVSVVRLGSFHKNARVGAENMRDCKKNRRKMFYSLLDKNEKYVKPVEFQATLSTGQSTYEETPFGKNVSYDRVISTCDMSLPINENSLIWYKNEPVFNEDGTINPDSADYKVAALPLDGLNSIRIAIKQRSKAVVEEVTDNTDKTEDSPSSGADDGF